MAWLPTLIEHRCSVGERGGFLLRLREGTWPGHILEHVTLELQTLAGTPGRLRQGARNVDARRLQGGRSLPRKHVWPARPCTAARELLLAAIYDRPFDVRGRGAEAARAGRPRVPRPEHRRHRRAAAERGHPGAPSQRRQPGAAGPRQEGRAASGRPRPTGPAPSPRSIAQDKELTKRCCSAAGMPVPQGRPVDERRGRLGSGAGDRTARGRQAARRQPWPRRVHRTSSRAPRWSAPTRWRRKKAAACSSSASLPAASTACWWSATGSSPPRAATPRVVVGDGKQHHPRAHRAQLNSDPRRGSSETAPLVPGRARSDGALQLEQQGHSPTQRAASGRAGPDPAQRQPLRRRHRRSASARRRVGGALPRGSSGSTSLASTWSARTSPARSRSRAA